MSDPNKPDEAELLSMLESNPAGAAADPELSAQLMSLQDELTEKLGAPVLIQHTGSGKGKVVVSYHSLDELDGILAHIK